MSNIYNTCQRCGKQRDAWDIQLCDFNIGGFVRRYGVCATCCASLVQALEVTMKQPAEPGGPPEAGEEGS